MMGGKKRLSPFDDHSIADTRLDHLSAMIDHCKVAKQTADSLDEKFLAYLLAMAIQEAEATMRRNR